MSRASICRKKVCVVSKSNEVEFRTVTIPEISSIWDPYVLNYLGFAHRKLGETDAALAYYHKALALRPDFTRARSYLGEGYVALGRIDEARRQLALIKAECGSSCEEYRVLDAAISGYLARRS